MRPRLILTACVLLAFGTSVTHGFHLDDYAVVHGPPQTEWITRPLTAVSFALNSVTPTQPSLWHLLNVLVHLLNVILLLELLQSVVPLQTALLGAAIFAVHPIQAESVAYVYSRATLLSTLFSICSCLLWLRKRRWAAAGVFTLALLAKEDCATVPLVVAAAEWTRSQGRVKKMLAPLACMFSLASIAAMRTLEQTRAVAGVGAGFQAGITPLQYLWTQGAVVLRYVRLVVVPYGFTVDPEISAGTLPIASSWAILCLLAVLAWKTQWRAFGGLWFVAGLLLLLPSSSIFPLADLSADHRMYLPMAAFAASLAIVLERTQRRLQVAMIAALVLLSAQRMSVWASDEELWKEAVERAPDKLRPRIQLARALNPRKALESLADAKTRWPRDPAIEAELGRVYLELGRPSDALLEFGKVLAQTPYDGHAINNRGVALRALGQEEAAKADFARALKAEPCLSEARRNLNLTPCATAK